MADKAQEDNGLKRRRRVMSIADFKAEDIAAIEQASPPSEAALFDREIKAEN